jgi:hypothetical protein
MLPSSSTLKWEAAGCFETLKLVYQTAQRHAPENCNLNTIGYKRRGDAQGGLLQASPRQSVPINCQTATAGLPQIFMVI